MDSTNIDDTSTSSDSIDTEARDFGDYDEDYTDEEHDAAFGSTVEEYYEQFQEQLNITIL